MTKQLVIAACLVNYGDDRGGVHADVGEFVEVTKKQAEDLASAERTLYVSKKDDHMKDGRYTASEAMIKAAEAMVAFLTTD